MPDRSPALSEPMRAGAATFSRCHSDAPASELIAVGGQLDADATPRIEQLLCDLQIDAALVVLDLRALEFIDSSGARLILAADRRARATGGRLVVVQGPEVAWFLTLTGLDRHLEIVDEPPQRWPGVWSARALT